MATTSWSSAYRGLRVLLTGHTGFKGSWLAQWLTELGAEVTGFALPPERPSLFEIARVGKGLAHLEGDVRDLAAIQSAWRQSRPDIVFHLAAQALVRQSYRDPLTTVQTNILGTAHVLETARASDRQVAVVVVTSDKCYENREWVYGYREDDPMGGHDIYSMSKGAAELLVSSWRRSFFATASPVAVASARAGNVIGGGDWATDRMVPDCVRALARGEAVSVRRPHAVRPWQHVLEPLSGYLTLGARLLSADPRERNSFAEAWNFGPQFENARPVSGLADAVVERWGSGRWVDASDPQAPHEASLLRLCIDKAHARLGWAPRWDFATTVRHTVDWYRACEAGEDMAAWCRRQIAAYVRDA